LRVVQVISARDYGKTQDGITMKSGCARVISAWHPCQAEILPFAPDWTREVCFGRWAGVLESRPGRRPWRPFGKSESRI